MSQLTYATAILLGIIQGLTEFLPISSSAHLALTQGLLGIEADRPQMILFDVLTHVGTLVAVFIVFARPTGRFLHRLVRELFGRPVPKRKAWRIVGLAVTASVPTAAIGLGLKDFFGRAFGEPAWIGAALLVTGALLMLTAAVRRPSRGWMRFRWWQAAAVGVAQGLAIMPGVSRSGATICTALVCGLRRRWAAQFSFLIAAPAILGATVITARDAFELPGNQLAATAWGPVLTGSVVSAMVGVGALIVLLKAVQRAKLHYFAWYCWLLGGLILTGVGF